MVPGSFRCDPLSGETHQPPEREVGGMTSKTRPKACDVNTEIRRVCTFFRGEAHMLMRPSGNEKSTLIPPNRDDYTTTTGTN